LIGVFPEPSGDIPARWPRPPLVAQNRLVTLRDVILRLDQFADDETIYAESATPTAEAVVTGGPEQAAPLPYLLEVALAREAVEVWAAWRPGQTPSLDDKVAAVIYYAQNDAWLPVEEHGVE
jgi:hypothetical protein